MFGNQPGTLVLSPKELTWGASSSDLSASLWSYPFNTPLWIGMSPNKFKTYMSKMMLITNSSFLISPSLEDTPICCASNLGMVQDPQSTCSNLVASFSACKSLDCPETAEAEKHSFSQHLSISADSHVIRWPKCPPLVLHLRTPKCPPPIKLLFCSLQIALLQPFLGWQFPSFIHPHLYNTFCDQHWIIYYKRVVAALLFTFCILIIALWLPFRLPALPRKRWTAIQAQGVARPRLRAAGSFCIALTPQPLPA